jgi:hypothetical protein
LAGHSGDQGADLGLAGRAASAVGYRDEGGHSSSSTRRR